MKAPIGLITLLLLISSSLALAQGYLTPLDFGLHKADHGRIDYRHTPPNILCGNFNNDSYPDIARFVGNKLEIYIFLGKGYSPKPQGVKCYNQPIISLALTGDRWTVLKDLTVTLADGSADTIRHHGGCLDLQENAGFLPQEPPKEIPRYVSEFDFQVVWSSDPRPYGMDRCAVGDLDNDGINELVTWWSEHNYTGPVHILIYKCTGDNLYELALDSVLLFDNINASAVTALKITDLDSNGLKEVMYTYDKYYFLEFTTLENYHWYRSAMTISAAVTDAQICDFNQNGVPEIAIVTSLYGDPHPTYYEIDEYTGKTSNAYFFNTIAYWSQEWEDDRLAIGDFDNDGVQELVSGNFGFVWGQDPVDIQYFRCDTTSLFGWTQHWLHTGIPYSCATPVIADLDGDGRNELFAGGLSPYGGSVFIWKPLGPDSGYVAWTDSTLIYGPNESVFGIVNQTPVVGSLVLYVVTYGHSIFYLFGQQNSQYGCLWQSQSFDRVGASGLIFNDIDQDGQMDLLFGADIWGLYAPNKIFDWEQTTSGIWKLPVTPLPATFRLQPVSPNPFNGSTMITYDLMAPAKEILLRICDISGSEISEFRQNNRPAGEYKYFWNASGLASGVYLINLKADDRSQTQKAILVK